MDQRAVSNVPTRQRQVVFVGLCGPVMFTFYLKRKWTCIIAAQQRVILSPDGEPSYRRVDCSLQSRQHSAENRPWASILEPLIQIKTPTPPFLSLFHCVWEKNTISTKCHHLGCSMNCLIIKCMLGCANCFNERSDWMWCECEWCRKLSFMIFFPPEKEYFGDPIVIGTF